MNKGKLVKHIEQNIYVVLEVQRQPYSFCQLMYAYGDDDYYGMGFSKVRHPDPWDAELGALKACKRAVADIYRQVVAAKAEL